MNTKNLVRKISSVALNGAVLAAAVLPFTSFASPVLAATPKLELTNIVDKQQADRGEILSYSLTVKNTGDVDLTNTLVWINQPNLADYVPGSTTAQGLPNGKTVTVADGWVTTNFNMGALPVGKSALVKYQTKVAQNANPDNILWSVASAKSDQASEVHANSWTRTILKTPNICAEKTADKTTVGIGDTVNFTIKVCNKGNVVLHNILVGDIIHAPLTYVTGTTTLTVGTQVTKVNDKWLTESLNIGNLNPGEEAFIKYQVKVADSLKDGETIQNVAQIKSDETPNILKCAVVLRGKVLGTVVTPPVTPPTTPPTTPKELPNTGPGEVLLIAGALAPAGFLLRKFRNKI